MKKLPVLVAMLSVLAFLNACNKDDNTTRDTTKPIITLQSPASGDIILSGNTMNVTATINEDTDLSQYKIEIHDDFDGHTHLKTGSPAFTYSKLKDISGKTVSVNFTIDVPMDVAAGPYHFIMNALDKAGNEAAFAEAEFTIKNAEDSVSPTLSVTANPAPSAGVIHLHGATKSITLACAAGDNKGLNNYEIKLYHKASKVNYLDRDGTLSGTNNNFNETITFDDAWPDGDYLLVIEAIDLKNNVTEVEFDIMRMK